MPSPAGPLSPLRRALHWTLENTWTHEKLEAWAELCQIRGPGPVAAAQRAHSTRVATAGDTANRRWSNHPRVCDASHATSTKFCDDRFIGRLRLLFKVEVKFNHQRPHCRGCGLPVSRSRRFVVSCAFPITPRDCGGASPIPAAFHPPPPPPVECPTAPL